MWMRINCEGNRCVQCTDPCTHSPLPWPLLVGDAACCVRQPVIVARLLHRPIPTPTDPLTAGRGGPTDRSIPTPTDPLTAGRGGPTDRPVPTPTDPPIASRGGPTDRPARTAPRDDKF